MARFGAKRIKGAPIRKVAPRGFEDGTLALALADIDARALNVVTVDEKRRLGVVVLTDGAYRAFNLQCPHLGADFSEGTYCAADNTLRCAWHGYVFDLAEGRFTHNPNVESLAKARVKGKYFDPEKTMDYHMRLYPAAVAGDELRIELK
jgi:nitrite reductase/ring-hydroxylating ferredoxin subunit